MSVTNFVAKKLINYKSDKSFAFQLRRKRAQKIMALIDECYIENTQVNIIDIGGTRTYWDVIPIEFLSRKNVHITVVNLPSTDPLPENDELFSFINGDGCNLLDISDKAYHISHSNSVIEHVGDWDMILKFSNETKRVAKKFYLQTPNFYFPVEPHFVTPFFHWLPKRIRIKLVMKFGLGWFKKADNYEEAKEIVEGINLLSRKDLLKLFPNATLHVEKMGPFVKSLILIG